MTGFDERRPENLQALFLQTQAEVDIAVAYGHPFGIKTAGPGEDLGPDAQKCSGDGRDLPGALPAAEMGIAVARFVKAVVNDGAQRWSPFFRQGDKL
ncbi:hypothetical protein [Gluconobacter oxydans]|uniref:hypothetical protein n=1 Tax=Gluconobacter oxydans TaxID=442 RepID=UPI0020A019B2|nr:hypothetical protein [Gluconobacter oxydans]MCP1250176.1 hypothetical protein [Gluconobacter oxydans]